MAKCNCLREIQAFIRLMPTTARWTITTVLFSIAAFFLGLAISLYAVYVSLYAIYISSIGEPLMVTPFDLVASLHTVFVCVMVAFGIAILVFVGTIGLIVYWCKHPYESVTDQAIRGIVRGIIGVTLTEDKDRKVTEIEYVLWQTGKKLNRQYKLYNKSNYRKATRIKKNNQT